MAEYRADPRADKVDLGLGVYKDPQGQTPVMRAVKAAEARLVQGQETKSYTTLSGDPAFRAAMAGRVEGVEAKPGEQARVGAVMARLSAPES